MPDPIRTLLARGRYVAFARGAECGEESWRLEREPSGALVASGVQTVRAPHPFPSALEWRATTDPEGRIVALDVAWRVGPRTVRAGHRASGERWAVTVDVDGHARAQHGDYPARCEVMLGTHGVHALAFRRYVLEPGAVHAFPALLVGPPWMAVEPGHHELRATHAAERDVPAGRVRAVRVEVNDPAPGGAPSWACWVDAHGVVLESFEGLDPSAPWMRLVDIERAEG